MYAEQRVPLKSENNFAVIGIEPHNFITILRLYGFQRQFITIPMHQIFPYFQGLYEALEWGGESCLLQDDETGSRFQKNTDNNWILYFNHAQIIISDDSLRNFYQMQDVFTRYMFAGQAIVYEKFFNKYVGLMRLEGVEVGNVISRLTLAINANVDYFEHNFLFDTITKLYAVFVDAVFVKK